MSSPRTWFMVRLAGGLTLCIVASGAYLTYAAWQRNRTVASAFETVRAQLGECATQDSHERELSTILTQCGTAATAARETAHTLYASDHRSDLLASSGSIFIRVGAGLFGTKTYSAASERLAAFALDIEPVTAWWSVASVRFLTLSKYDPVADMFERSATEHPQDFIRRLYLAKAALLLVNESVSKPEAQKMGGTISGIPQTISLVDQLIIATDHGDTQRSDSLRQQYMTRLSNLRLSAADAYAQASRKITTSPWPAQAAALLKALK